MSKKINELYKSTKQKNADYRNKVEEVDTKLSEMVAKREDLEAKTNVCTDVEDFKKLKAELSDIDTEINFLQLRKSALSKKESTEYPAEWRMISAEYESRKDELAKSVAKHCAAIVSLFDSANEDVDLMRNCVAEIAELYNVTTNIGRPTLYNLANPAVGGFDHLYLLAEEYSGNRR